MTTYPNREIPLADLQIGDVVRAFDGPWGTAIVQNVTDTEVTFFRPYGHGADGTILSSGMICYIGLETFKDHRSRQRCTYFVYQREGGDHRRSVGTCAATWPSVRPLTI